jgi:hypothetical protein
MRSTFPMADTPCSLILLAIAVAGAAAGKSSAQEQVWKSRDLQAWTFPLGGNSGGMTVAGECVRLCEWPCSNWFMKPGIWRAQAPLRR